MLKLINPLLFLIPVISALSTPSLSFVIPVFFIVCLYNIRDNLSFEFNNLKLELYFSFWLLISCFWSLNILGSMASFLKIFAFITLFYVVMVNSRLIREGINFSTKYLSIAFILSLALYSWQNFTGSGAFLALFAWFIVALLIKEKKYKLAFSLYLLTFVTLFISGNIFLYSAFIISGLLFFITKFWPFHNPNIIFSIMLLCIIAFLYSIYYITPQKILDTTQPISFETKRKLVVWDFALNKIIEKPFVGWGIDASKEINQNNENFLLHNNEKIDLLPEHPSNNILQTLLETGIIGLLLYIGLIMKYLNRWNYYFKNASENNLLYIRSAGYAFFSLLFIISMSSFNMWESCWFFSYFWIISLLYMIVKE